MSNVDRCHLQLIKKHQRGNIPRVEWLDRLAFRSIERINEATDLIAAHDDRVHLFIDLPDFEWPVLFHEQVRYALLTSVTNALAASRNNTSTAVGWR